MRISPSAGLVAYTGDIRLHGRVGGHTLRFAEKLSELDLALLICEGPQAPRPPGPTEEQVRDSVIRAVAAADGLAVGDFGARNVERLEIFLEAARHAGRQLVVLAKDALLLHAMHTADPTVPVPHPVSGPLVYRDRRARTGPWQRFVADRCGDALVGAEAVSRAPGDFVLALSYFDLTRLLDVGPAGGVWIFSSSEPYNEEQLLDMHRLRNWMGLVGMRVVGDPGSGEPEDEGFHASGHASGPDLLRFITTARPRRLLPVHVEADGLAYYRDSEWGWGEHLRALRGTEVELIEPVWGQAVEIGG